jgi:dTDP-4-amino-4,6-dideoxygalactose transaminase
VHYIPVHRQPYYRARYGDLHLPGAEAWYARCLSLPLFPSMADADVDRVVEALAAALGRPSPAGG